VRYPEYETNHTVDNIHIIVITTISSTSVNALKFIFCILYIKINFNYNHILI